MTSNLTIRYDDDGPLCYFVIDTQELFNLDLDDGGLYIYLQQAFNISKREVPVKTGLMKKSYTMKRLNKHAVMMFFDPQKIIGQTRKIKTTKGYRSEYVYDYYPAYLKDTAKRYDWLDKVMKSYLDSLKNSVKLYNQNTKKRITIETSSFNKFFQLFMKNYKSRLQEAIALRKEQSKK